MCVRFVVVVIVVVCAAFSAGHLSWKEELTRTSHFSLVLIGS